MAKYLLIESRDPFEHNDVQHFYNLAESLARAGNQVTLFLIQNGVLPVRPSNQSGLVSRLKQAGVEILADEFSLRERGIGPQRIIAEVTPSPLDAVIDRMAEGCKTLWH